MKTLLKEIIFFYKLLFFVIVPYAVVAGFPLGILYYTCNPNWLFLLFFTIPFGVVLAKNLTEKLNNILS